MHEEPVPENNEEAGCACQQRAAHTFTIPSHGEPPFVAGDWWLAGEVIDWPDGISN